MRDIKFRSWNGHNMVDLKATTKFALHHDFKIDGLFIPFKDEFKLMQYTGLKDKKGVEIFEGDIVSVRSGASKSVEVMHEGEKLTAYKPIYNIAVIVFYKSAFGLHKSFDTKPHETTQHNGTTYFGTLQSSSWDIEVVGNVYEHPELLNDQ